MTISSITLLAIAGCSRPHPLAEWDPDAYAPENPTTSWSADWWPAARDQDAARELAAQPRSRRLPSTPSRSLLFLPCVFAAGVASLLA